MCLTSMSSESFFSSSAKEHNNVTPRSSLTSIGVPWRMWHRGVPNAYSIRTSYQVQSNLKYYSMLRSLVTSNGIPWRMQHRGSAKCLFYGDLLPSV